MQGVNGRCPVSPFKLYYLHLDQAYGQFMICDCVCLVLAALGTCSTRKPSNRLHTRSFRLIFSTFLFDPEGPSFR